MIQTVLFDVDGVFLSEERYFDASALTVHELLRSENYLGLGDGKPFQTKYSDEEIAATRSEVFLNDDVLNFLKSRGMNANWDMIYITISEQLIHLITQLPDMAKTQAVEWLKKPIDQTTLNAFRSLFKKYPVRPDFKRFMADYKETKAVKQDLIFFLNEVASRRLGIETAAFKPKSDFWHIGEHASQEWYIGDENVLAATGKPSVQTGKKGFMNEEVTLADPNDIRGMFHAFHDYGIHVGIATGRPRLETFKPFTYLNWIDELDSNHIVTADDVLAAERSYEAAPLAKPHPFTYLVSYHGKDSDLKRWTARRPEQLPDGEQILIVGDSLADLLCAKQLGCRFAGVLTGLSGQKARSELEEHGADFILDSIADVKGLVLDLLKK
ncbi:HAD hydrolase-like protein [Sporolactobacillus shoreicorticis]|uniref:HAD family hydrolase n=1 Tax=Sporolactobacillus shoreicorticis TaxID=1923877 RepID=A0ABW5RZT7_9BACL|nr:HAD hydrolase-like protein [Sporolactobacillus shoreicorticis]MCO7125231.1 HAD hydrolase-like protein [Sporolactobacillus shoreicorticis]